MAEVDEALHPAGPGKAADGYNRLTAVAERLQNKPSPSLSCTTGSTSASSGKSASMFLQQSDFDIFFYDQMVL